MGKLLPVPVFNCLITLIIIIMSKSSSLHCRSVDSTLSSYFSTGRPAVVIGFGSLLSEKSARSTFPSLSDFKPVRVDGYRRVFTHPTAIFFERGIADKESKRMASLSIERFIFYAYEVLKKAFNLVFNAS